MTSSMYVECDIEEEINSKLYLFSVQIIFYVNELRMTSSK